MNLVLTVVVIAGTYMLACLLLSALGRVGQKSEPETGAEVAHGDAETGGWSPGLHPQSTSGA